MAYGRGLSYHQGGAALSLAGCAKRANTSFTLVGNSADSRGLAQCRATVCCTLPNARVEQCPAGASVRTPGSPRSGAEGKPGVRCSTRAFPPERSGGGNDQAHLPAGPSELRTAESRHAPPVRCSALFGAATCRPNRRCAYRPTPFSPIFFQLWQVTSPFRSRPQIARRSGCQCVGSSYR
jgi:hypothetical protein